MLKKGALVLKSFSQANFDFRDIAYWVAQLNTVHYLPERDNCGGNRNHNHSIVVRINRVYIALYIFGNSTFRTVAFSAPFSLTTPLGIKREVKFRTLWGLPVTTDAFPKIYNPKYTRLIQLKVSFEMCNNCENQRTYYTTRHKCLNPYTKCYITLYISL